MLAVGEVNVCDDFDAAMAQHADQPDPPGGRVGAPIPVCSTAPPVRGGIDDVFPVEGIGSAFHDYDYR